MGLLLFMKEIWLYK